MTTNKPKPKLKPCDRDFERWAQRVAKIEFPEGTCTDALRRQWIIKLLRRAWNRRAGRGSREHDS